MFKHLKNFSKTKGNGYNVCMAMARFIIETDDLSVCPNLYTDELSHEVKNVCGLIKMQVRPDGLSVCSIIEPMTGKVFFRKPNAKIITKDTLVFLVCFFFFSPFNFHLPNFSSNFSTFCLI